MKKKRYLCSRCRVQVAFDEGADDGANEPRRRKDLNQAERNKHGSPVFQNIVRKKRSNQPISCAAPAENTPSVPFSRTKVWALVFLQVMRVSNYKPYSNGSHQGVTHQHPYSSSGFECHTEKG